MPRKLALVVHSLAGGGTERVVSLLANHWCRTGQDVAVITLDSAANDRFPLESTVHRIGLDVMRDSHSFVQVLRNTMVRLVKLRRAVNRCKAELVISFGEKTNVLVLAACWALRQRVVVCERTDPRHHSIGQSWSWLRRRVYPRCDALVVQTEAVRSWARGLLSRRPIYVIPNAAPPPREFGEHAGSLARLGRCIVGLGRLSPEKGFDLLISAFSRIADKYPEWQLRIWGDGAARSALEQLVKTSSLEKRVELPGWTSAPEAALAHADVFVLPSRYEGFPNALLEAMAQGKACVSFDCESGPREIIRDGVDGILVRTIHAEDLAAALTRVLSDTKLRRQLGENARHVAARYSPERFFQLWDLVVDGVSEECLERFASRLTERKD